MKKYFVLSFIIIQSVFAQQYALDALRFSLSDISGSARYVAMGGALGALGCDISVVQNNPAGIGMLRNTELSFTPGLNFASANTSFEGKTFSEDKFNFLISSAGGIYAKAYNRGNPKKIQFLNIGLSFQRTANFNQNVFFEGTDSTFSLIDYFAAESQGASSFALNPDYGNLAFKTFLMDTISNGVYENLSLQATDEKKFYQQYLNSGSTNEVLGSGAINWGNKLFFGASLGISFLNYTRRNSYTEVDVNNLSPYFNSLTFNESGTVTGLGFNVKAGVIYKPIDWFRFGVSISTPTWYSLDERKNNEMVSNLSIGQLSSTSSGNIFEYELATPWKLHAAVGFIILKNAALGVEYDWVNYSNISLRPSSASFNKENAYIDTNFFSGHNVRFGAEYKFSNFRARVGYHFQSNPYRNNLFFRFPYHTVSFGAGFKGILGKNKKRSRYLILDLAYSIGATQNELPMMIYATNNRNAIVQTIRHTIVTTVGIQF